MPKLSGEAELILNAVKKKKCFVLSGGAGSGKTHTLVEVIGAVIKNELAKGVACLTYTNAAAEEVKGRVDSPKLKVSTIHDFLWDCLKGFQCELKKVMQELVESQEEGHQKFVLPEGETLENGFEEGIQYREYVRIKEGIISHDEVLILALEMFRRYPKLCRIVANKYPCIFVDEYQDTSPVVVELLLDCLCSGPADCVVGFFGDAMQAIYDGTVGSLQDRIDSEQIEEIKKEQNRRNPRLVIELANRIRDDGLVQHPSEDLTAPNMLDGKLREGVVQFLYSSSIGLDAARAYLRWDDRERKELNLTHNLIADEAGFRTLMEAYNGDKILGFARRIKEYVNNASEELNTEGMDFGEVLESLQAGKRGSELRKVQPTSGMQKYIDEHSELYDVALRMKYDELSRLYVSKDHLLDEAKESADSTVGSRSQRDELIRHLFRIHHCIQAYETGRYADFIKRTEFTLRTAGDKAILKKAIESLRDDPDKLIGDVIDEADAAGLVRKGDKLNQYIKEKNYVFNRVACIPYAEFQCLYRYLEGHTPFSTQHKTKGREYPCVLVVLDNGKWSDYNFQSLFVDNGTTTVIERTRKLFYVCCTRAMEELAVVYFNPTNDVLKQAREWFGDENVVDLDSICAVAG